MASVLAINCEVTANLILTRTEVAILLQLLQQYITVDSAYDQRADEYRKLFQVFNDINDNMHRASNC